MIDKKDIINTIMDLFDEKDSLHNQLIIAQNTIKNREQPRSSSAPMNLLTEKVFSWGKKLIMDKIIYSWRGNVEVTRDEEGILTKTSYKNWLRSAISESEIPGNISKDDFYSYFESDFKSRYESECEKAKEAFLEKEKEVTTNEE